MNDILLVDDEYPVLESLTTTLDWSEFGFKHVRTAQCAEDAMRIMKEHKIDLLVLDILMPGMSGLDMIKAIRSRHPETHCILISAHSKFEYAREALRLNLENYLLKPIDRNELQETVYRAVENINKESRDLYNLFERNMLERWLYGRITNDELLEHSRFTGYNVLMRRYYALAVHLKGNVQSALHALAEQLKPALPAYELDLDESSGVILTGGRDVTVEMLREAAANALAIYPGMKIVCGTCAASSDVSRSLADAQHAMEYARLSGLSGFIAYDDIDWDFITPTQQTALSDMLHAASPAEKIQEWACTLTEDQPEQLRSAYAHLCLTLCHIMDDSGQQEPALAPVAPPYSLRCFQSAVEKAVAVLCESQQQRMHALSPIIQRAVSYISENITSPLSIKQFCEQTKANAAYIGRLFKEETGMYFSDYVNIQRINRAKILLETSDMPVSEISRNVGIYDVSYFTQRFKKQVRMSPMKYRQSVQQHKDER